MIESELPERLKHVARFIKNKPRRKRKPVKDGSGFVYLVQCKEFVKIGIAINIEKRISEMVTGNPFPIKLLKSFHSLNPYEDERRLHARLYHYHHKGEWYRLPRRVLDRLLSLDEQQPIAHDNTHPSKPIPRSYLRQRPPTA